MRVVRSILVLVTLLFTLVVNFLANAMPFNGVTTADVSNSYPVYFVPAGYVFAIWGVIYTLMIGFAFYQLASSKMRNTDELAKIQWLVVAVNLVNAIWLWFWHQQNQIVTVFLIFALFGLLTAIYLELNKLKELKVKRSTRLLVLAPFSVYYAWLCVAMTANITVTLYTLGFSSLIFSGQVWVAILAFVIALITFLMLKKYHDWPFALVIIWALFGIYMKFPDEGVIAASCLLSCLLVTVFIFLFAKRPKEMTVES